MQQLHRPEENWAVKQILQIKATTLNTASKRQEDQDQHQLQTALTLLTEKCTQHKKKNPRVIVYLWSTSSWKSRKKRPGNSYRSRFKKNTRKKNNELWQEPPTEDVFRRDIRKWLIFIFVTGEISILMVTETYEITIMHVELNVVWTYHFIFVILYRIINKQVYVL